MSEENLKDKELIFSYNLTEGNFLVRKRRFKEAIQSYSRALQITNDHEVCLTMRSKCYLLLGEHDKALEDSEAALANNPTSNSGIIQKAEALYAQGEFEYALVCFHRGKRLRPDIEDFMLGIQKSAEAIENSIGEKSGLRFCRVGKVLKQLQDKQEKEAQAATWRGQKRKQTPTEQDNAKKDYGCKTLLEELSQDKAFLQRLIHHPELTGTCKDDIVKEATEVLEFMQTRQEFWGQQKPLYARKIQKKMAEGKTTFEDEDEQLRKRIEEKKNKIQSNHETITRKLVDIDSALQRGSYDEAITMCVSAEEAIKSYSLTWLPRRQAYLGVVYSALGDAHLKLGHYREALQWHNKDFDLSRDNPRLLHSRARALDNLGRTHATFRKYQAAIDAWEQRIPLSKSPEKRTWLYHEIGTCYHELGRYETARFYGTKCVKEARRCEQNQWIMRGLWLLAEAETQLEVVDAALKHFDQAIQIARKSGSKQEAKDLEQACKRATDLLQEREAAKKKAKAMYNTVGVISQPIAGNVTFEDQEGTDSPESTEPKPVNPDIVVSVGSEDSGDSTLDVTDSFDDTGSYVDWTDEDTLPPEECSQDELAAAKVEEEEAVDENTSSEGEGSGSDEDTATEDEGEESELEDGQRTPTESEAAGETEYETAVADSTAAEDDASTAADEDEKLVTADEGEDAPADGAEKTVVADSKEGAPAAEGEEGAPAAEGEAGAPAVEGEEGAQPAAGAAEATKGEETQAADGAETVPVGDAEEAAPAADANGSSADAEVAADEGAAKEGAAEEAAVEEGAPDEGAAEERAADEGAAEEGAADEGAVAEGAADEGAADEGVAQEGTAEEGAADEGGAQEGAAADGAAEEGAAADANEETAGTEVEGGTAEPGAEEAPAEPADGTDAAEPAEGSGEAAPEDQPVPDSDPLPSEEPQ
ncbi:tetratricopeptide repeat protein 25-like [Pollicipes pollicipes]|uniref:tetratricopeptide repeat protein 25-like n=1 Tax=Pollicipes pollicipes TaxID=41117 RepID=UPI00188537C5|nr:tetratricopeptide repeat protein 25-like [Pollicipes pollicipes]